MRRSLLLLAAAAALGALRPTLPAAAKEPGGKASSQPPVARVTKDFVRGRAPLEVCFDASKSLDREGKPLTYRWEFGDGSDPGPTARVCHEYGQPGLYAATVTVTNDQGLTGSRTVIVFVSEAASGS